RNWALGSDGMAEWECFSDALGDSANYLCASAGGEAYPVYDEDGNLINSHLQNLTLIVCAF
ncbi:MAG: hypothetical protein LBM21_00005, partial [Coriobacteriales bacterium]|nr:hypothetical protein [Coriobacteriales bacterium]